MMGFESDVPLGGVLEEIDRVMERLEATTRKNERDRIVDALRDLPVHLVDARFHPDDPADHRHAILLSDAIGTVLLSPDAVELYGPEHESLADGPDPEHEPVV